MIDMDEKNIQNDEIIEINLRRVIRANLNHAWIVILISVLCTILSLVALRLYVTPEYNASVKFYVNNGSLSKGGETVRVSTGDLTASRSLVDSYIVILQSRETLCSVIEYAGMDMDVSQLSEMISAKIIDETEIFEITVTGESAQIVLDLSNAISEILPQRIDTIVEGAIAKVVDAPVLPKKPGSIGYKKCAMLVFVLAAFSCMCFISLREIFDTRIRAAEDITQVCRYPLLAEITNLSDSASEVYKALRTKLMFLFTDRVDCRLIGISSARNGEGKSKTAINLALSLSKLNKKILLVECNMRKPIIAHELQLPSEFGLSDYLTGRKEKESVVQRACPSENEIDVIAAGNTVPNPVELLNSEKMKELLFDLRQSYDYILMDFPAVGEVSDAILLAGGLDGILLTVRREWCDQNALQDAVNNFEYVNAKVLGIIFNNMPHKVNLLSEFLKRSPVRRDGLGNDAPSK